VAVDHPSSANAARPRVLQAKEEAPEKREPLDGGRVPAVKGPSRSGPKGPAKLWGGARPAPQKGEVKAPVQVGPRV
jgi:hypothetical protein